MYRVILDDGQVRDVPSLEVLQEMARARVIHSRTAVEYARTGKRMAAGSVPELRGIVVRPPSAFEAAAGQLPQVAVEAAREVWRAPTESSRNMLLLGKVACAVGTLVLLYFVLVFDTTVANADRGINEPREVNNIGLLTDRICGTLLGMTMVLAGTGFLVAGNVVKASE